MDFDTASFALRRTQFSEAIGDGFAVVPGGQEKVRNHDNTYPFRQDSDFFFLTGFPEPEAVAVINPTHPTDKYVLFVRPKDRMRETWDGYRAGVEGAVNTYGADAAFPMSDLAKKLREYAVDRTSIFYQLGNARFDDIITSLFQTSGDQRVRSGWTVPSRLENPGHILHELRLVKSAPEAERLVTACEISAHAHREAMRFAQPGMFEYQLQGALEFIFRQHGSERDGYPSIVGSGPNACILHYRENQRRMEDGDLVLIDAGAEFDYFSADITRTFPVSGTFTAPQRAIYEVVLAAHQAALAGSHPGGSLAAQHATARRVVAEGLVELGLIPGDAERAYEMGMDREFFMHGTGHWLGMDVHDAGRYRVDRKPREFEPGMAFTVEPGVYIDHRHPQVTFRLHRFDEEGDRIRAYEIGPAAARAELAAAREKSDSIDHDIPSEFLGIGVRIEDDVLITEDGHRNMTEAVPVLPDEVEALCAEASALPRL
ncbi:MAG: aminopeptidase P N-terminal domain-containing protein [Acidimicrobiia bacterium]|nr:aminopeptidase P N-terminal domain-containing protein [Acidimicrobiia bacterium]